MKKAYNFFILFALFLGLTNRLGAQTAGAQFYQDCNYGGYAVTLAPGNYTTADLQARGIRDNDISSAKLNGFDVTVYKDNNYGGVSWQITSDAPCLVSNGWNDQISSLKVSNPGQGASCSGVAAWNLQTAYTNAGALVVYNNKLYVNNWYSQGQNPEQNSGLYQVWTLKGTCSTGEIRVTEVKLDFASVSLNIGASQQLKETVLPTNATTKTVSWSSSDVNIATVSSGLVTAKANGTATITVTTQDGGKIALCTINVSGGEIPVSSVSLNYTGCTLKINTTQQLTATVLPVNATNKAVSWASSDNSVATVSQTGLVLAKALGTTVIKVTTQSGLKTANCTVNVTTDYKPVSEVSLDVTSLSMLTSSTRQLIATMLPVDATNKAVNWSSNNINVAKVSSSGLVSSVGVGNATITVTTVDNQKIATCAVSVSMSEDDYKSAVATHFFDLGKPYGGCGVPQDLLETQNFVALNVFNTPGNYSQYIRPIRDNEISIMGEFKNGYNCGRWVEVTICEDCNGTNDGHENEPFCRGGSGWYNDSYSGAKLYMVVADACGDGNAWCRDSRYHLDLATNSLNKFEINGQPVNDMLPLNWNNRQIKWKYIPAPNYSSDIKIYFMQNAQFYWPAIMINNLPNGIHGVEQKVNGQWVKASRNSDMGQAFILPQATTPYIIRVIDANDQYVFNSREYTFNFPAECGGACSKAATQVAYTTNSSLKSAPLKVENKIETSRSLIKVSGNQADLYFEKSFGSNARVLVYNALGQPVCKESVVDRQMGSISLGSFKTGFYVVKIVSADAIIETKKFVVQ